MKYVVFSDVHGNAYAFDAMMKKISNEETEGYLFCGDLTGHYYDSIKIYETIKRLPNFYAVRGNHDELYLNVMSCREKQNTAINKFGSSYMQTDKVVEKYLMSLPVTLTATIGNYRISMVHGSLDAPLDGRIYPDTPIEHMQLTSDFLFVGHTHYQMNRRHSGGCKIINPGSLGQPRDGKGFSFCIADFSTGEISWDCVNFDLSDLLSDINKRDSEKPYLSKVLLRNRGALS